MSGPTPITATNRLVFNYNSLGDPHVYHALCVLTPSGDSTGFSCVNVNSSGSTGVSTCADAIWQAIANLYETGGTQFGSVVLQTRVGTAYVDVAAYQTALTATGVAVNLLSRLDVVMKAHDNKFIKATFFAHNQPINVKGISFATLTTAQKVLVDAFTNQSGTLTPGAPFFWLRSRGDSGVNIWRSYITKIDDKIRRKKGLA